MVGSAQDHTKKTFFSGVLLLTLSTVLVKVIGLFYKIPMLTYLGSVGMGYFNSAYEIYALFCVISTAGLPVALSVLVSASLAKGDGAAVRRIYRGALYVFLLVGALGSVVMLLFARTFCHVIQSERAYACILSIAPTVFFVCVSSALRGYFQGYQRMMPTAVSQILESVGKLVFGLTFARFALQRGYDTATVAAFAGAGLTLGTLISMLYLIFEKMRFHPIEEGVTVSSHEKHAYRSIWKKLARLSIPMTLGASLVSLTKLIDMTMILRRLQAIGYTEALANEAYGSYTTLALSVFGLLPSLINGIALPLVPMLSAAIASGDREKQEQMIGTSYRLTALFAIPASLGISAFARPVLLLLFGQDAAAVAIAAPLLSYLGISVFLSCMITASNSVLHAYQVVNRPILALVAGAGVKVLVAYLLIGNPSIALAGAPISTFFCNATVVLLNLVFAARVCHTPSFKEIFLRPLIASAAAIGIGYGGYLWTLHRFGESAILTVLFIALSVLFCVLFFCRFGVLPTEDILALPMGEKLYRILYCLHFLPRDRSVQATDINNK